MSGFLQMAADPNPDDKDWNCNGGIAGAPLVDINGDGVLNTNTGFDDWEYPAASGSLRFAENVVNYADGAGQVTSAGSEMSDEEALARGFMLVVVEPAIGLLPGCSSQSFATGRLIPLVVYGTPTLDATAIPSAASLVWNGAVPSAGFLDDVDGGTARRCPPFCTLQGRTPRDPPIPSVLHPPGGAGLRGIRRSASPRTQNAEGSAGPRPFCTLRGESSAGSLDLSTFCLLRGAKLQGVSGPSAPPGRRNAQRS